MREKMKQIKDLRDKVKLLEEQLKETTEQLEFYEDRDTTLMVEITHGNLSYPDYNLEDILKVFRKYNVGTLAVIDDLEGILDTHEGEEDVNIYIEAIKELKEYYEDRRKGLVWKDNQLQ